MNKPAWRRPRKSSTRSHKGTSQLIRLIGYLSLQMGLMGFSGANKYKIYAGFLFLYPYNRQRRCMALVVGFLVGLLIDCYYNTIGLHALACTVVMQLKNLTLKHIPATETPSAVFVPSPVHLGWIGFVCYTVCMAMLHHAMLYATEGWLSPGCFVLLRRAAVDGLVTAAGIVCIQCINRMQTA